MAWQGVPFMFTQEQLNETVRIALSSIPKIVIDSPPDYTNVGITAGVSILAGLIPALIAVWTFKRNAENTKIEREKQQHFLREERSNHQDFLKIDREKQQISFEEDRKTQITIAKNNFDMQVLSGNRQGWINTLRDLVAEYTVEAAGLINSTFNYKLEVIHQEHFHNQMKNNDSNAKTPGFSEKYREVCNNVNATKLIRNQHHDKESLLSAKILMMINPKEDEYQKILDSFLKLREFSFEIVSSEGGFEDISKLFGDRIKKAYKIINEIISLMQIIFKREWERVKAGV